MRKSPNNRYLPLAEPVSWTPPTPPELSRHSEVTLDCETNGLRWYDKHRPVGIAVRLPATGESFYLPWGHRGGQNLDESVVKEWCKRELRGKRIRNINTRFDINMLRAWGVDLSEQGCSYHDVAHSAALLDDHRRQFNLDLLAKDELGEGKLDPAPKSEIAELPAGNIAEYAIRDCSLVDRLYDKYAPQLAAQDLGRVSRLEDDVIAVVAEMEWNGCPIDEALLAHWTEHSEQVESDMRWRVCREAGFQVDPDREADLSKLFKSLGIENPHRTEKGAPSFTGAFMRTIAHPLVKDVFRLGKLIDLRRKYLLPYGQLVCNGKLYGSFHQLRSNDYGTVSGRFSSSNPNLQQVMTPGKQKKEYGLYEGEAYIVKALFVPESGDWFCADQEQVEFRFAGHYANCKRVLDTYHAEPAFELDDKGERVWIRGPRADFHVVVRNMIRTVQAEFARRPAKDCNFAKIYMAGLGKLAMMMGVEVHEAAKVVAIYDEQFPEMGALAKKAMRVAEERGYVKTILGRRSRFKNGNRSHKALNCVIQGSSGDLNKMTLVELYKQRKFLELVMRITVHDEFNGDAQNRSKVQAIMDVLNTQWISLRVPILWAGNTGRNWAEAK